MTYAPQKKIRPQTPKTGKPYISVKGQRLDFTKILCMASCTIRTVLPRGHDTQTALHLEVPTSWKAQWQQDHVQQGATCASLVISTNTGCQKGRHDKATNSGKIEMSTWISFWKKNYSKIIFQSEDLFSTFNSWCIALPRESTGFRGDPPTQRLAKHWPGLAPCNPKDLFEPCLVLSCPWFMDFSTMPWVNNTEHHLNTHAPSSRNAMISFPSWVRYPSRSHFIKQLFQQLCQNQPGMLSGENCLYLSA